MTKNRFQFFLPLLHLATIEIIEKLDEITYAGNSINMLIPAPYK